jgi:hypothetical protein
MDETFFNEMLAFPECCGIIVLNSKCNEEKK